MSKRIVKDADYDFETGEFTPAVYYDANAVTFSEGVIFMTLKWLDEMYPPSMPRAEDVLRDAMDSINFTMEDDESDDDEPV